MKHKRRASGCVERLGLGLRGSHPLPILCKLSGVALVMKLALPHHRSDRCFSGTAKKSSPQAVPRSATKGRQQPLEGHTNSQQRLPRASTCCGARAAAMASSSGSEVEHTFQNDKQQQLSGTLLDAGTPNLCILCHGLSATRNSCFLPELAQALASKGFSTFR